MLKNVTLILKNELLKLWNWNGNWKQEREHEQG